MRNLRLYFKKLKKCGRRKELYYFRDQQGLEVDFLFPDSRGGLWMVESKASRTVQPAMAAPMMSLRKSISPQTKVRMTVVHRTSTTAPQIRVMAPGVEALDIRKFVGSLS